MKLAVLLLIFSWISAVTCAASPFQCLDGSSSVQASGDLPIYTKKNVMNSVWTTSHSEEGTILDIHMLAPAYNKPALCTPSGYVNPACSSGQCPNGVLYDSWQDWSFFCVNMQKNVDGGDGALDDLQAAGFIGAIHGPYETLDMLASALSWGDNYPLSNYLHGSGGGYPIYFGVVLPQDVFYSGFDACVFDATLTTKITLRRNDITEGMPHFYAGSARAFYIIVGIVSGTAVVLALVACVKLRHGWRKNLNFLTIGLFIVYAGVTTMIRQGYQPIHDRLTYTQYLFGMNALVPCSIGSIFFMFIPVYFNIVLPPSSLVTKAVGIVMRLLIFGVVVFAVIFPGLMHAAVLGNWQVGSGTTIAETWMFKGRFPFYFLLTATVCMGTLLLVAVAFISKAAKMSSNRQALLRLVRWTILLLVVAILFLALMAFAHTKSTTNDCDPTNIQLDPAKFVSGPGFPAPLSMVMTNEFEACNVNEKLIATTTNAFYGESVNVVFLFVTVLFLLRSAASSSSSSSSSSS